jgi:hypothetical protein
MVPCPTRFGSRCGPVDACRHNSLWLKLLFLGRIEESTYSDSCLLRRAQGNLPMAPPSPPDGRAVPVSASGLALPIFSGGHAATVFSGAHGPCLTLPLRAVVSCPSPLVVQPPRATTSYLSPWAAVPQPSDRADVPHQWPKDPILPWGDSEWIISPDDGSSGRGLSRKWQWDQKTVSTDITGRRSVVVGKCCCGRCLLTTNGHALFDHQAQLFASLPPGFA